MSVSASSSPSQGCPPVQWESLRLPAHLQERLAAGQHRQLKGHVSVFEGFGSFHSENVEDLMAMDETTYRPPQSLPAFAKRVLGRSEMTASTRRHRDTAEPTADGSMPSFSGRKRTRQDAGMPHAHPVPPVELSNNAGKTPPAVNEVRRGAAEGSGDEQSGDSGDLSSNEDPANCRCPPPSLAVGEFISEPRIAELVKMPAPVCEMGAAFRAEHFTITPEMVFINHGAFGSTLAGAMLIKRLYEAHMEREVVEFVDRELLPLIVYSTRALSRFLGANPQQVVLLQNATFALNSAMRMIEKDDVVAFLDTEYLAVYKMMWFRCEEVGATLHEIALNKFLHDETVMGDDAALTAEVCRHLPAGCTTIVLDYVTSTSALCLPVFTHLIPALRARGVQKIIVDGAHAPLQMALDFNALPPESQPTVFVGNLHKWFSSPKSAGFFWVREADAERMHSVVLSHGAGEGLLSEFIWDGTRDYGAYLSIPAIVDFWEAQGIARVRAYCSQLLLSAAAMLTTVFGSRPVARHAPFMSLVELPEALQDAEISAKYIQDSLHDIFQVEVPVKRIEERYYLRISAFVYNTAEEYLYLREAVLSIASMWTASTERAALQARRIEATTAKSGGSEAAPVPCDERIRRQGGCGVLGLDSSLKRKKTTKFA